MIYYDYPEDKKDIFECIEKNYFFKGDKFSYLCAYDEIEKIDMRIAFSGFVLAVYKRYAIVKNGSVLYKNERFSDSHIAKGRYMKHQRRLF